MRSGKAKLLANVMIVGILAITACDKDKVPIEELQSAITKVEGPTSAGVGQEIQIKVTLEGYNGCAGSGQLHEIINNDSRTITGKIKYQGTICSLVMVYMVLDYTFKSTTPGTYQLRFLKNDGSYINHSVTVS